jgi:type VI secretion system protein ImpK
MGIPDLKNTVLFPDAYGPDSVRTPAAAPREKRFSTFAMICAGAPLVLFAVLFVLYRFILGSIGDSLINLGP